MNCATHEETPATAFCRNCGRAVCEECRKDRLGVPHCPACDEKLEALEQPAGGFTSGAAGESSEASAQASTSDAGSWQRAENSAATPGRADYGYEGPIPALAFILGLIPGVGAVYNGQYAKGVVHALLWGGLLGAAITSGQADQPGGVAVFVVLLALATLYMPIEAVQTARALRRGEELDDMSGLLGTSSPVGGVLLIALGVIFLLHSLGYWRLADVVRFWPLALIALGIHILYRRVKEQSAARPAGNVSSGPLPRITPEPPSGGTTSDPKREAARVSDLADDAQPEETASAT